MTRRASVIVVGSVNADDIRRQSRTRGKTANKSVLKRMESFCFEALNDRLVHRAEQLTANGHPCVVRTYTEAWTSQTPQCCGVLPRQREAWAKVLECKNPECPERHDDGRGVAAHRDYRGARNVLVRYAIETIVSAERLARSRLRWTSDPLESAALSPAAKRLYTTIFEAVEGPRATPAIA